MQAAQHSETCCCAQAAGVAKDALLQKLRLMVQEHNEAAAAFYARVRKLKDEAEGDGQAMGAATASVADTAAAADKHATKEAVKEAVGPQLDEINTRMRVSSLSPMHAACSCIGADMQSLSAARGRACCLTNLQLHVASVKSAAYV